MKVTILCSNPDHPVMPTLRAWSARRTVDHEVALVANKRELAGGDILFLVSCSEIIAKPDRDAYGATLLLHASDLPKGRGWSPHVWDIANGATAITVSLLEAEDKVDSGKIWAKRVVEIPKHALSEEINEALFKAEIALMDYAIENMDSIVALAQPTNIEPSYYRKRSPADSRLDPSKSIADQFNLLRVCDPDRYPAFFDLHGKRFKVRLEKMHDTDLSY